MKLNGTKKGTMKHLSKLLIIFVWLLGLFTNFISTGVRIGSSLGSDLYEPIDYWLQTFGGFIALLVTSALLLSPLILLKKIDIYKKALPYTYLILSLLSLASTIINARNNPY